MIRTAALALTALLSACATITAQPPEEAASELTTVPFFPQEAYQCGPAALATLLVHSGVAITPEALVPQVYLPGRGGSLQVELLAATRRSGRIPFTLQGGPEALFRELEAGNPVLVLQNLGREWLPRWHYAVVIGYQPEGQRVLLRSGTERRRLERWNRFSASWAHADYWGLVIPRPGEIPASGHADSLARELAGQERLLEPALVAATWDAARERWPEDPNLLFAAANAHRVNADTEGAAQLYYTLLMQSPQHIPARNNFADLLLQAGCPVSAERLIAPARHATTVLSSPIADAVRQTAADIARQRAQVTYDPDYCRALTQDPTLP